MDDNTLTQKKTVRLVGQPLKFETPDQLREVLQQYFDETLPDEWTVTGLALRVGSKQCLDNYSKRKGYTEIVFQAKLIVENGYEVDLKKHGRSGSMFALKNFGWIDEKSIEHKGKIGVSITQIVQDAETELKTNTDMED